MSSPPDRVLVWASQVKRNEFPAVCAMTGQPAETRRKFRFVTVPGWAYLFLVLICTGIGLLPIFIIMAIASRRATGYLPLTRSSQTKLRLATWIPFSLIAITFVLWVSGAILSGVGQSTTSTPSKLVYTTWVSDSSVVGGAEPAYRPQLTGLTGKNVKSVDSSIDSSGSGWVVNVAFDEQGTELFRQLTTANVAACPGDPATVPSANCPERHLALWVGLTQADIDSWAVGANSEDLSDPWKAGATGVLPGKLLSNPITIEPITGGHVQLSGNYTKAEADAIVRAIQPGAVQSGNSVASGVATALLLLGLLCFLAGVTALLVIRGVYGPTGKVMAIQPGYTDSLVEIRRVHAAFVAAVQQQQQARAAQWTAASPLGPPFQPDAK